MKNQEQNFFLFVAEKYLLKLSPADTRIFLSLPPPKRPDP